MDSNIGIQILKDAARCRHFGRFSVEFMACKCTPRGSNFLESSKEMSIVIICVKVEG